MSLRMVLPVGRVLVTPAIEKITCRSVMPQISARLGLGEELALDQSV